MINLIDIILMFADPNKDDLHIKVEDKPRTSCNAGHVHVCETAEKSICHRLQVQALVEVRNKAVFASAKPLYIY